MELCCCFLVDVGIWVEVLMDGRGRGWLGVWRFVAIIWLFGDEGCGW